MKRQTVAALMTLLLLVGLLAACGGTATPAGTPDAEEPAPTEAAAEPTDEPDEPAPTEAAAEPTEAPSTSAGGDVTTIRWYVGLGTGTQPEQLEGQQAVVEAFNAEHDDIELVLEIVPEDQAYDTLQTQIAAGNPPDIVGPVGVRGMNGFRDAILDLTPLIEESGYDLSDYPEALVEFWYQDDKQVGIPFAVFPSYISYNRDLFDEAGLPYPPTEWGPDVEYDGKPWNFETLRELGMLLTVDANGNDATSPDFDPENIVQFGFVPQWSDDPRAVANMFGAGTLVGEDGNVDVPDAWRDGWNWWYNGMWEDHFIPNGVYLQSDLFPGGNAFGSGNVAMARTHLWFTCCYADVNWGVASMPANDGEITANLHADTFVIMEGSQHPEEAFEVISWLFNDAELDLLAVYGGLPAHESSRDAFMEGLDEQYGDLEVDWDVALEGLNYPDNPSHEGDMPDFNRAQTAMEAFQNQLQNTPDLDVSAAIDELVDQLQTIFTNAQ